MVIHTGCCVCSIIQDKHYANANSGLNLKKKKKKVQQHSDLLVTELRHRSSRGSFPTQVYPAGQGLNCQPTFYQTETEVMEVTPSLLHRFCNFFCGSGAALSSLRKWPWWCHQGDMGLILKSELLLWNSCFCFWVPYKTYKSNTIALSFQFSLERITCQLSFPWKKKCMKARGVFSHTVGGRICAYSISSQSGPFPFGCLVRIPWAPSGIFGAHQFPFTHVPLDPCAGTDIESQEALKPRTPLSPLNKLLQCNLTCGTDKTTLTELFPAK